MPVPGSSSFMRKGALKRSQCFSTGLLERENEMIMIAAIMRPYTVYFIIRLRGLVIIFDISPLYFITIGSELKFYPVIVNK